MLSQFFQRVRLYALHFSCLLGVVLLCGCDIASDNTQVIDTKWHRQDLETHLSRWLAVAPTPSGLLLGSFDRQWRPVSTNESDLTTHSRLIFAMVMGYEITGDARYLEVAVRGTDFLLSNFRDPLNGGFFARVDTSGRVINAAKNTYGHAFALLALSHMARVTKEEKYRVAALNAWRDIDLHLSDSDGGFRPEAPRDFGPSNDLRTQNPVMHMFEALLALVDATGDPQALAGGTTCGAFRAVQTTRGATRWQRLYPRVVRRALETTSYQGQERGGLYRYRPPIRMEPPTCRCGTPRASSTLWTGCGKVAEIRAENWV
ncbi:exported protein of unknown function [Candidatus Nitrotoga arctica]|uniref:Uncharacterized protein n=1 Tax=Candidatus Nitrotoga arctica TaxID=453162 RepID=A0ABM8YVL9_9PROT|nr:exported protein of unknown function [Candidatus Nitrotoga arctica]